MHLCFPYKIQIFRTVDIQLLIICSGYFCAVVFLMAAAMSWRLYRASRHQVLEAATTEERAGLLTTGNSGADQREPSYTGL